MYSALTFIANNPNIQSADCIILLYDLSIQTTKDRIESFWLPMINGVNDKIPVIIAGNKQDLVEEVDGIEEYIDALVLKYPQIEIGIALSAKYHNHLADLVYCVQRAVIYPIYPLYNQSNKEIKQEYENALRRIFRMCDMDHDNYLNDSEMEEFQTKNFSVEVTTDDINTIKEILIEEVSLILIHSVKNIKKKRKN
jgi:Ras family protein T1